MRLLAPEIPVDLASTNVGESSLDEWSGSSVSYTTGDEVKVTSGQPLPHREYRARINHTSAADAPPKEGGNAEWIDIGATNQHRMFDGFNNSATAADDPSGDIVVEINLSKRRQVLSLLGLSSVESVTVVQTVGGVVTSNETIDMRTSVRNPGWWSWLFGERSYAKSLVYPLPGNHRTQTLTITLSSGIGVTQCAQCLISEVFDIGCTLDGAQPRIKKWSSFQANEFGEYTFVPRKGTRTGTYTLIMDTSNVDKIYALMEDLEERLVILDANNEDTSFDSIRAYGSIVDFAPGIEYNKTRVDIKIEGIN